MATASSLKAGLQKQFLECSICLGPFKNPRGLPCLHVCCTDCIKGLIEGKRDVFKCPYCKSDTPIPDKGVEGFPVAFYINALQDFVRHQDFRRSPIPCYNKKNDIQHSGATVKCLDCNVYYCDSCNNAHSMVAVAENHETVPVSDLKQEHFEKAAQKQVTYCNQHPTSPLNFYCKEDGCQIPVCHRCCIIKHSQHKIVDLEEIANQCRKETNLILKNDFIKHKENLDVAKTQEIELTKKAEALLERNKKAIDYRFQVALKKLTHKKDILISEAEANASSFIRERDSSLADIQKKLSCLEATKAAAENVNSFSPDDAIVTQHRELQENVKKVLQEAKCPHVRLGPYVTGGVLAQGDPVVYMNMNIEKLKLTFLRMKTPKENNEMQDLLLKLNQLAPTYEHYY